MRWKQTKWLFQKQYTTLRIGKKKHALMYKPRNSNQNKAARISEIRTKANAMLLSCSFHRNNAPTQHQLKYYNCCAFLLLFELTWSTPKIWSKTKTKKNTNKQNKTKIKQKAKNNKSKLRISWKSESMDEQHKGIEQQQRIDLHSTSIRQKRHITKQTATE